MTATLQPLVARYLTQRSLRGEITPLTRRNLRNHLFPLVRLFGARPLDQLGPWLLDRYLEECGHLAPSTRALRVSSARGFARWLVNEDLVARDFTRRAPKIRRPRQTPRTFTADDAAVALDACHSARERAIIWLEFGCALRCIEVSRLDVDDWDRRDEMLTVRGKALHQREVPVPAPVRVALTAWLAETSQSCGPLIGHADDPQRRLSASRISNLVGVIIRRAGLKQHPGDGRSAHGWRACAASDVLDVEPDPRVAQELLGHASLAHLARYQRRVRAAQVRAALDRRDWGDAA